MKKLIISIALALSIILILAIPIHGDTEQSVSGDVNVTVPEIISITLTDAPASGIHFGTVTLLPQNNLPDLGQSQTTPAVQVNIESGTNVQVDIGIMGSIGSDTLSLANWKFSPTFNGPITSLSGNYQTVFLNQTAGSTLCKFWHWLDIPENTSNGPHNCTITYKAVKTGTSF
jgi:hypothetical protein